MTQNDNGFINQMTKIIIRPVRDLYPSDKLGPSQFIVKTKNTDKQQSSYVQIVRKDSIVYVKGSKVCVSIFMPKKVEEGSGRQGEKGRHGSFGDDSAVGRKGEEQLDISNRRCLVYLHTNNGSRVEGADLAKSILPHGWVYVVFDFRGSGHSEGEYISMGLNESTDLHQLLNHLYQKYHIKQYSLWGRSMGAVTILYYLTKYYQWNNLHSSITIKSVILDSPFSNLVQLMVDIGKNQINLPQFIFHPFISAINSKIYQKLGIALEKELNLLQKIKNVCKYNEALVKLIGGIRCLFITSSNDKLVDKGHVQLLYKEYPFKQKQIIYLTLEHNQIRSDHTINRCMDFLCKPYKKQQVFMKFQQTINQHKSINQNKNHKTFKGIKRGNTFQQQITPPIIINNNYNVSININQRYQTQSPSNKANSQQGFFTDRKSEPVNIYQAPPSPIQTPGKYFFTSMKKQKKNQHDVHQFHSTEVGRDNSRSFALNKKEEQVYQTPKKQPSSPPVESIKTIEIGSQVKLSKNYRSWKQPRLSEDTNLDNDKPTTKLSLTHIKNVYKQEHQKCSKNSKIISLKKKEDLPKHTPIFSPFKRVDMSTTPDLIKQQVDRNHSSTLTYAQNNTQNYMEERQINKSQLTQIPTQKVRSLKTSLMIKNKPKESRKNSYNQQISPFAPKPKQKNQTQGSQKQSNQIKRIKIIK